MQEVYVYPRLQHRRIRPLRVLLFLLPGVLALWLFASPVAMADSATDTVGSTTGSTTDTVNNTVGSATNTVGKATGSVGQTAADVSGSLMPSLAGQAPTPLALTRERHVP